MRPLRQLGPYRIVRRLGAGGMAEVHLARRFGASGWEKQVALKLLREEHRGRADLERLLLAEARLGARFDHPGLVGVHDLGLAGGVYYVCMDYIDGGDLRALCARRPLPRPLALYVGEQLAAALAHVHALAGDDGRPLGLVHRDVSPGNVLLSRAGAVKLSDFGIAKATAAEDRTFGRLRKGKYAYMAPEQLAGEALSGAADIFALGVTLHELLLGRRPFDRPSDGPLQTMAATQAAELGADHDFGDLDDALADLLRRALARDPKGRFASARALARALQAAARRLEPAGVIELGEWVRDAAGEPAPEEDPAAGGGARLTTETLGMDEVSVDLEDID
ncbi:MAG: serine/threonine-protein kinase [Nannocystaceae bacterium]